MTTLVDQLSSALGVRDLPWVIRAYLTLFVFAGLLMVLAVMRPAPSGLTTESIEKLPATKLFNFASDAEKTILGALIGSLSLAATKEFGRAAPRGGARGKPGAAPDIPHGGDND